MVFPVVLGTTILALEPLTVRYRANLVKHRLEAVANAARVDERLVEDIWTNQDGSARCDFFMNARKELADSLRAQLSGIDGVTLKSVRHLDVTKAGANCPGGIQWSEDLPLAYLPPGQSAYINDAEWSYANINHSQRCSADARDRALATPVATSTPQADSETSWRYSEGDGHDDDHEDELAGKAVVGEADWVVQEQPHADILGRRSACEESGAVGVHAFRIDTGNDSDSLQNLSKKFPTELVAAVEVEGLFGTHKLALTVPFFPIRRGPPPVSGDNCYYEVNWAVQRFSGLSMLRQLEGNFCGSQISAAAGRSYKRNNEAAGWLASSDGSQIRDNAALFNAFSDLLAKGRIQV